MCISAKNFWQYITGNRFDTKITRAMVIAHLTRLNAKREKKSVRDEYSRTCNQSVYVLPSDLSTEIIEQVSTTGLADDEFVDDEFFYAGKPDKDAWLPQV
jgi:hypothetical protein